MTDMTQPPEDNHLQTRDWTDALDDVAYGTGAARVRDLLGDLQIHAHAYGIPLPVTSQTPYINTIPPDKQPDYPGDREIERRIKSIIRWNAMAMVVRANRESDGIGGHISSYASSATLLNVGQNHFFRGPDHPCGGDLVYFQGHSTPGNYARAFLEGRLSEQHLRNFRRELAPGGGLSSYPHPWLMPEFWQFPTVSMGLGPIMAIYQARYLRYLENRGLLEPTDRKVWAFIGDGETDEPETRGAISLAAREKLDNLIFVINCNLQRLDGPVRGNGKIVQELEAVFRGVGWNAVKVLWGSEWDELLERDSEGRLIRRLGEVVDGEYQKYAVEGGAYIREQFYGKDPALLELVTDKTDDQLWHMRYGGHDPAKVYAAYRRAFDNTEGPTVILAKTIKGYGLGEAGEGRNVTHQQKKLNEEELLKFRDRFDIPISDEQVDDVPFYRPPDDSPEMRYLRDRQRDLGGSLPQRRAVVCDIKSPEPDLWAEFHQGTGDREASTTMAFVRMLSKLLKDKDLGPRIVPIVPDEARTFGMEALFRQYGIYSSVGQLYDPVDSDSLLYYKEARDGQILEEGITEAGAMSSFIAAGTSHATFAKPMLPFFIYYSMFGFQRIGDLIWAAGDLRTRGFLIGGTAGRTTLAGEGLQHQDGHSHLNALAFPNLVAYDTAYAYEIAVIIADGIRRMCDNNEDIFYYLTVGNENYVQPPMPDGAHDGILKGLYQFNRAPDIDARASATLLGSGSILNEVIKAQQILADNYGVAADVCAVTSYKQLHQDAQAAERWNMLHPADEPRAPYVTRQLHDAGDVIVAASDYVKTLPTALDPWMPRPTVSLGTDGYGRSEDRATLRDFFEVDARYVALAALHALAKQGKLDRQVPAQAVHDLHIDPEKADPAIS
ncbi:MAG: pyruvate dehydrogenase (acetyl-transferring), homodimeric type [Planctomycetaceae bacterium]|nr:pyruvate dehydrogenase (acetyl-transferring), homodimeric type [Planctomycetaceae bacterium]